MSEYDDDFPTCVETYATLRVFSDSVAASKVDDLLGLTPTRSFERNDRHGIGNVRTHSGWMLSSRGEIASKDSRRHIDWLLKKLDGKYEAVTELRSAGCQIDVSCMWVSVGQGGPVLSPSQMKLLALYELEVWWDVYFDNNSPQLVD